jgi:O-antigen ligase
VVAGSNPAVPTPRVDFVWRSEWWRLDLLDTLYLLMGIIGFFAVIAVFFFGGFLLLDFIFARSGGDA